MDLNIKKNYGIRICSFIYGGTVIEVDFDDLDYEDFINLAEEVAYHQGDYRRCTERLLKAIEFLNQNEK